MNIIPQNGGELAIDLYLRYLGNPSEVVVKEVFEGLCRMGFCFPARREEIKQVLIAAYPKRGQFLKRRNADMSRTLPAMDAPITEEEYVSLRGMDAVQLTDVLRSQGFPMAGNSRETVILRLLLRRAKKGKRSTYAALFSLGEEVADSFRGLDKITAIFKRGASKFITDEEKSDAFLQFLETRIQQSKKKSEAIKVAAAVLYETYAAGRSVSHLAPIPGTERAIQTLKTLVPQITNEWQKDRIESSLTKLEEIQARSRK